MSDMKSIRFPQPIADDMVRAILEGSKTVTRRAVKPPVLDRLAIGENGELLGSYDPNISDEAFPTIDDAPYQPDQILYVQETWTKAFGVYWHKADVDFYENEPGQVPGMIYRTKWSPSTNMPKEAARLFLRVTGVRVERLQEITPNGISKEGIVTIGSPGSPERIKPFFAFKELWDSTIKKADLPRYGWAANPWVWVIAFERISREEAVEDES